MESEGPYFHKCGTIGEASNCKACAYEEGRKSMENDFNRLWEIAYTMRFGGLEKDKEFDVWKKARGIE